MKKITLVVAAFIVTASAFAQTWSLDKVHSKLGFGVMHLSIAEFQGNFEKFDATITSSKPDFSDAVIELTADISSIDTDNEQRDNHLKSPDFFDAAKYPSLTFKSKSIKKVGDKNYKVSGDLTMHGVTKPVVLDAVLNGTAVHPMSKKDMAGFTVTGIIKRSDFGIATSTPSAMLSDEVKLIANTEFAKN